MTCAWKPNWEETKRDFMNWWRHERDWFCVCVGRAGEYNIAMNMLKTREKARMRIIFTRIRAGAPPGNHFELSRQIFPADVFPCLEHRTPGPGSLALFMGSDAVLADDTVWFLPSI